MSDLHDGGDEFPAPEVFLLQERPGEPEDLRGRHEQDVHHHDRHQDRRDSENK